MYTIWIFVGIISILYSFINYRKKSSELGEELFRTHLLEFHIRKKIYIVNSILFFKFLIALIILTIFQKEILILKYFIFIAVILSILLSINPCTIFDYGLNISGNYIMWEEVKNIEIVNRNGNKAALIKTHSDSYFIKIEKKIERSLKRILREKLSYAL